MDAPIFRFDRYSSPGPHRQPHGSRVSLEVTRGRVRQRLRAVHGRVFLIGAASDCDLVLGDLSFPEAYAYLFVESAEVTIRWLGAGPELIVAGESVESAELFHGDTMAFGPFELQVLIEEAPESDRAASEANTSRSWMPDESALPFAAGHPWSPA